LQDVRTATAERQRTDRASPVLDDLLQIPERPILVAEKNDGSLGEPRVAAGVDDQHQLQQTLHLRLVGHQPGEGAPQPNRFGREVSPAAVALVEGGTRNGMPAP
jgi:hypothetical protein